MSAEEHNPFAQVGPGDDAPSGLGSDTAAAQAQPAAPAQALSQRDRMLAAMDAAGNTPEEIKASDRAIADANPEDPAEVIGTPEWAAAQEAAGLVRHDPADAPAAPAVAEAAAPEPEPAPTPPPAPVTTAHLPGDTGKIEPDPPRSEAERFDPDPTGPITLQDGSEVEVMPLRLRETMRLLRIITHGTGPFLGQLLAEISTLGGEDTEANQFGQTLLLTVITSIPDAENEAIDFIAGMVRPAGWDKLAPANREALNTMLSQYMANPELEDAVAIIERVIRRESEDLRGLGKKIAVAANMSRRVTRS